MTSGKDQQTQEFFAGSPQTMDLSVLWVDTGWGRPCLGLSGQLLWATPAVIVVTVCETDLNSMPIPYTVGPWPLSLEYK